MTADAETAKPTNSPMTDEHKAALAEGRAQGRAVRNYLEALDAHRPRRGRKRTPESVRKRLDALDREIDESDVVQRLQLVQERMDLERELDGMENKVDMSQLEADFVSAARGYSARKGITYAAWREVGVPASALKSADIPRGA